MSDNSHQPDSLPASAAVHSKSVRLMRQAADAGAR